MINNDTYKRAMTVSDYNRGRSVNDLQLKTWEHGKTANMRSDSIWLDDRYNPIEYSHPNRNDNVNFPQQEFKDFFGRTEGTAAKEDYEKHRLSLSDGTSKAMHEHASAKRVAKLRDAVAEVDNLNHKGHH